MHVLVTTKDTKNTKRRKAIRRRLHDPARVRRTGKRQRRFQVIFFVFFVPFVVTRF